MNIIDLLLASGASVDGGTVNWGTPLWGAALCGQYEAVLRLLDAGANVDRGTQEETPLTGACNEDDFDMVKLLIERGADVNYKPSTPRAHRPLDAAVENGSVALVQYLLEAGARVDLVRGEHLEKLLKNTFSSSDQYRHAAEKLQLLDRYRQEQRGAEQQRCGEQDEDSMFEANASNPSSDPPHEATEADSIMLDTSSYRTLSPSVILSQLKDLSFYFDTRFLARIDSTILASQDVTSCVQQIDRLFRSTYNISLLHAALTNGSVPLVRSLVTNGLDINGKQGVFGRPVLHEAIQINSSLEMLTTLLDAGAGCEITDKLGRTALTVAAEYINAAAVRILLSRGADPNGNGKRTPLMNIHSIKWPYHRRTNEMRQNWVVISQALIDAGADVNMGRILPLQLALGYGESEFVEMLLKAGAKQDCLPVNYTTRSRATDPLPPWPDASTKLELLDRYRDAAS